MPYEKAIQPQDSQREEVEKVLFSWNAPSRPYVQKTKEFWVRIIAIASIFGFIIFIVEGAMPVILMVSLIFLFYVLSTVRPENIEYNITNLGVKIGSITNLFTDIRKFWFSKRGKDDILVLDMSSFTGRLEFVINKKDKNKIRNILKEHLPEEEPSKTSIDKASEWVNSKLSQSN
jgi:hypothetical protein